MAKKIYVVVMQTRNFYDHLALEGVRVFDNRESASAFRKEYEADNKGYNIADTYESEVNGMSKSVAA